MTNKEMKSAVCALGNRLAAKASGVSRSDAFIRAWAIVKAGALTLPVKGVSFGNRQEALRRLAAYKPSMVRVYLVPEPGNPVDRNAVAVMVGVQWGKGLFKIGYVPREAAIQNTSNTFRALKALDLGLILIMTLISLPQLS
jgi:hypothetical protein